MLTDTSIDACQRIPRKQFSVWSGLQDTILGQKLMFKEWIEKFVQILHNGSFHYLFIYLFIYNHIYSWSTMLAVTNKNQRK